MKELGYNYDSLQCLDNESYCPCPYNKTDYVKSISTEVSKKIYNYT